MGASVGGALSDVGFEETGTAVGREVTGADVGLNDGALEGPVVTGAIL